MDQNVDNWSAEPIPPGEARKDALKEQRSFAGQLRKVQIEAKRWLWWFAGTSNLSTVITLSVLGIVIYRQQDHPPMFIVLNRMESGAAYTAIPAKDAVKWFDSNDRKDDVEKYINARLGYIDVLDHEQWLTVRAMSSPAQFTEYDGWRASRLSPVKQLGTNGHIILSDWQDDQHPIQAPDGAWSYTVKFRSQQVKDQRVQMVKELWQATITFRYIPDINLPFSERHRNRRGFQCITFEAKQL